MDIEQGQRWQRDVNHEPVQGSVCICGKPTAPLQQHADEKACDEKDDVVHGRCPPRRRRGTSSRDALSCSERQSILSFGDNALVDNPTRGDETGQDDGEVHTRQRCRIPPAGEER